MALGMRLQFSSGIRPHFISFPRLRVTLLPSFYAPAYSLETKVFYPAVHRKNINPSLKDTVIPAGKTAQPQGVVLLREGTMH